MMDIRFSALDSDLVRRLQSGGVDANGQTPERHLAERNLSDGSGVPCRHCLEEVAAGDEYLILALRPFPDLNPYAELGPIFLHARPCARYCGEAALPAVLENRDRALIKGYTGDHRIKYGTGRIVDTGEIPQQAEIIFEDPEISYIHVRSALNNCYTCRIDRSGS